MYLPSNTPILEGQRKHAAHEAVCSDNRIQAMRRVSASGRAQLFNTLVDPATVAATMGTGAALDTARLQQQTETSRATGILGTAASTREQTVHEIVSSAPEVVSLNRGGGCQKLGERPQFEVPVNPAPLMPARAPRVVNTPQGPLNFTGAAETSGIAGNGLTGYAPPWSDAWVMQVNEAAEVNDVGVGSWVSEHPWLSLAIAGAGVFMLARRSR